jgi:hypothetical protein
MRWFRRTRISGKPAALHRHNFSMSGSETWMAPPFRNQDMHGQPKHMQPESMAFCLPVSLDYNLYDGEFGHIK